MDYEKAWLETAGLLKQEGRYFTLQNKRKENDLMALIQKVRTTLLDIGFTETIVPVIIEKGEVYLQYGPEAPVILDRIFFLAGLDRPDIGISEKRLEEVKQVVPRLRRRRQAAEHLPKIQEGQNRLRRPRRNHG